MKNEIRSVQGLRAFAFILIFTSHVFGQFRWAGAWGVSIFLVLSGFLAAYANYDVAKPQSLVVSRIKKIYPLHILTLICAIPLCYRVCFQRGTISVLMLNMLLLQAWIPISSVAFSYNGVSWYLSLFIFLSLITPASVCYSRNLGRYKIHAILGCIFLQFFWYLLTKNLACDVHWLIYIFPMARVIDFIIGLCLYQICDRLSISRERERAILIGLLVGCMVLYTSIGSSNEIYSVFAWSVSSIFLVKAVAADGKRTKFVSMCFGNKIMYWLGSISMELFLIHQLCIRYITVIFNNKGIKAHGGCVFITAFITSLFCSVIWKWIVGKLKDIRNKYNWRVL